MVSIGFTSTENLVPSYFSTLIDIFMLSICFRVSWVPAVIARSWRVLTPSTSLVSPKYRSYFSGGTPDLSSTFSLRIDMVSLGSTPIVYSLPDFASITVISNEVLISHLMVASLITPAAARV